MFLSNGYYGGDAGQAAFDDRLVPVVVLIY